MRANRKLLMKFAFFLRLFDKIRVISAIVRRNSRLLHDPLSCFSEALAKFGFSRPFSAIRLFFYVRLIKLNFFSTILCRNFHVFLSFFVEIRIFPRHFDEIGYFYVAVWQNLRFFRDLLIKCAFLEEI